jgi:hypothetical protein
MKNKLFKRLLTIGLPLALAACIFSGCASMGGGSSNSNDPPGILTITGIPAEYEGKFVSANMMSIPNSNGSSVQLARAQNRAIRDMTDRQYIAIVDGEVKLPFYIEKVFGDGGGYAGPAPGDVTLEIKDREKTDAVNVFNYPLISSAIIASVAFEDGVAQAKWSDAFKPIYITVTNIPEIYSQNSTIEAGQKATRAPLSIGGVVVFGFETASAAGRGSNWVRNGTTTVPVLPWRKESGYIPFPASGTMDIVVTLSPPSSGSGVTVGHVFLFKDMPITNGRATLDFRRGVRQ